MQMLHCRLSGKSAYTKRTYAPCAVFYTTVCRKMHRIYRQKWKCDIRNRDWGMSIQSYA